MLSGHGFERPAVGVGPRERVVDGAFWDGRRRSEYNAGGYPDDRR